MDVVIIATNTEMQAEHWQNYLDYYSNEARKYYVVHEDWPGGADNGLGTLYAYKKSSELALKSDDVDFEKVLHEGGVISLFHCAGKGKRLFPLTASECNNKSAIKLPSGEGLKTILEKVVELSLEHLTDLVGRLAVFWGDQIFLPSTEMTPPTSHAEIFAMANCFPTQEVWNEKKMQNYGLVIESDDGKTRLVEKTTYPNLLNIVGDEKPRVGISLGSFSVSRMLLSLLMQTFNEELMQKKGQLNTDYHFWMPFTWDKDKYCNFMRDKGEDIKFSESTYDRMQEIKRVLLKDSDMPIFGVHDVGENALWWDFGNLVSYSQNILEILLSTNHKGQKFAELFGLGEHYYPETNSILYNCAVDDLDIKDSVLFNVKGKSVKAHGSIVINADVGELNAERSLLYSVVDSSQLKLEEGDVRADIFFEDEPNQISLYTKMGRDNKLDWDVKLPRNPFSFAEIHSMNESQNKK